MPKPMAPAMMPPSTKGTKPGPDFGEGSGVLAATGSTAAGSVGDAIGAGDAGFGDCRAAFACTSGGITSDITEDDPKLSVTCLGGFAAARGLLGGCFAKLSSLFL